MTSGTTTWATFRGKGTQEVTCNMLHHPARDAKSNALMASNHDF